MPKLNKKLQVWAEKKQRTLKKWAEEYGKLCKKEGIYPEIVSIAFNSEYVAGIFTMDDENNYIIKTEAEFKNNGKWRN